MDRFDCLVKENKSLRAQVNKANDNIEKLENELNVPPNIKVKWTPYVFPDIQQCMNQGTRALTKGGVTVEFADNGLVSGGKGAIRISVLCPGKTAVIVVNGTGISEDTYQNWLNYMTPYFTYK